MGEWQLIGQLKQCMAEKVQLCAHEELMQQLCQSVTRLHADEGLQVELDLCTCNVMVNLESALGDEKPSPLITTLIEQLPRLLASAHAHVRKAALCAFEDVMFYTDTYYDQAICASLQRVVPRLRDLEQLHAGDAEAAISIFVLVNNAACGYYGTVDNAHAWSLTCDIMREYATDASVQIEIVRLLPTLLRRSNLRKDDVAMFNVFAAVAHALHLHGGNAVLLRKACKLLARVCDNVLHVVVATGCFTALLRVLTYQPEVLDDVDFKFGHHHLCALLMKLNGRLDEDDYSSALIPMVATAAVITVCHTVNLDLAGRYPTAPHTAAVLCHNTRLCSSLCPGSGKAASMMLQMLARSQQHPLYQGAPALAALAAGAQSIGRLLTDTCPLTVITLVVHAYATLNSEKSSAEALRNCCIVIVDQVEHGNMTPAMLSAAAACVVPLLQHTGRRLAWLTLIAAVSAKDAVPTVHVCDRRRYDMLHPSARPEPWMCDMLEDSRMCPLGGADAAAPYRVSEYGALVASFLDGHSKKRVREQRNVLRSVATAIISNLPRNASGGHDIPVHVLRMLTYMFVHLPCGVNLVRDIQHTLVGTDIDQEQECLVWALCCLGQCGATSSVVQCMLTHYRGQPGAVAALVHSLELHRKRHRLHTRAERADAMLTLDNICSGKWAADADTLKRALKLRAHCLELQHTVWPISA